MSMKIISNNLTKKRINRKKKKERQEREETR